jgi:hypothetical protein
MTRPLKLLGLLLRANADTRRAYAQMQKSAAFLQPVAYTNLVVAEHDGLVLPGGHWARGISSRTGKSVLSGRKTTALTWSLEKAAWSSMKFLGRVWDPGYYRTYMESNSEPPGYRSVQAEVTRALASPEDFRDVPNDAANHFRKASVLFRDSARDGRPAWVIRDGRYVSARWPGDVHHFAAAFAAVLAELGCTGSLAGQFQRP